MLASPYAAVMGGVLMGVFRGVLMAWACWSGAVTTPAPAPSTSWRLASQDRHGRRAAKVQMVVDGAIVRAAPALAPARLIALPLRAGVVPSLMRTSPHHPGRPLATGGLPA